MFTFVGTPASDASILFHHPGLPRVVREATRDLGSAKHFPNLQGCVISWRKTRPVPGSLLSVVRAGFHTSPKSRSLESLGILNLKCAANAIQTRRLVRESDTVNKNICFQYDPCNPRGQTNEYGPCPRICIPGMHSRDALQGCIPWMHSTDAFKGCTPGAHSRGTIQGCILGMHSRDAFQGCIPGMHYRSAFQGCT